MTTKVAWRWLPSMAVASMLVGVAVTRDARADTSSVERAEALFNEGKALLASENYTAACSKLDESRRLSTGIGVTLYLANCEDHMGRRATALALYEDAESMAHAKKDARESVAHQLVAQLDTEAARVRVHAPNNESGWAAMLDERAIAITNPRGFPVDPGTHTLRMVAPDGSQWSALIRVEETPEGTEGLIVDVDVPAPRAASPPHSATKVTWGRIAQQDPSLHNPSTGSTQRAVAVGVGAFGVVGLGIGAYFGIRAKTMQDASNAAGGGCNSVTDVCNPYGRALRMSAVDSATASTVLFAISASAIATGLVLYLTAPSRGDLTVAFDARNASLRGRF